MSCVPTWADAGPARTSATSGVTAIVRIVLPPSATSCRLPGRRLNLALGHQPPRLLKQERPLAANPNLPAPPWDCRQPRLEPDLLPCSEVGKAQGHALAERP